MGYIITTKEHGFRPPVTWNRRKGQWQPYDSKDCIYPTNKGAARIADKLSRSHMGMTMKIQEIKVIEVLNSEEG